MIPEHRRHLARLKAQINNPLLIERDEFEQSVHAKLYCVELSGTLEHMLRDCCINYCANCANKFVNNFVSATSKKFPNPRPDNIIKIVSSFDESWGVKLEAYWAGEIKDAVGSIVANRHKIAHGENCGVSIVRIRTWHVSVENLSNYLWGEIFELN